MNISGISSYWGFYDYNSIRSEEVKKADYAERYQPDFEYGPSGADRDIYQLDVTRAISDMQKDQVLLQYQFFVGGSRNADGVRVLSDVKPAAIREMEDFAL